MVIGLLIAAVVVIYFLFIQDDGDDTETPTDGGTQSAVLVLAHTPSAWIG